MYLCPNCGADYRDFNEYSRCHTCPKLFENKHYKQGKIEPLGYMKDQFTPEEYEGFLRGNVLKYITRYPHKNGLDDLRKAQDYLRMLIELYEQHEIKEG